MKSTEPLSMSPKKLNLDSNSTRIQQSVTLNGGESLPKPQLVTKMVETSEIENNICDTSKQTVEVHVHQVNGYSSEDCSKQEKFVDSGRGREVVDSKSSSNCSGNRSDLERSCTKLSSSSGNGGLRSELETGCTKSTVNGGSRSESEMNCTKPNLTSRDSAVFDVDPASGDDEISCFEEVSSSSLGADKNLAATPVTVEVVSLVNGYKKQSQDPLLQKLSSPVKTNGESLVNGDIKHTQDSLLKTLSTPVKSNCVSLVNGDEKSAQDSLSSREIKTVSGDVERKQRTGSIFSKNGLRDSFKNMKRSIVGSASSNGLVENRSTLKDGDQKSGVVEDVKISSRDGEQRNGVLQGSGDQNPSSFGVPQGSGDQNPSSFGDLQRTGDQNPSSFGVLQGSGDQNPSSFGVPQGRGDRNPSSFGVPQGSDDKNPSSFGVTQGSSGLLQGLGGVAKCSNGPHLAKASSLESLSDAGGRFERDSELRRSKSSMNGFCSGRSRSDPDEDIDDLLLPGGRQNNEGFDHLPLDSGVESAASSWDRMAESAHARLQDELRRAHHKLKLKDEEVTRLSRIRNEVEAELEELTASLFQEAHNMVREANVAQAAAEKALKESHMQIDVLTAEVAALKTLVLTSTPSRPNPHLHPQIDPKSKEDHGGNGSGLFRKQHRRSPSHFNLKYGRENSPPDSPAKEQKAPQNQVDTGDNVDMLEVDPNFHRDFMQWKQAPSLEPGDPFVARLFGEDIDACLAFNNAPLAARVRQAISEESICIEAVNDKSRSHFPMKCALLEVIRQCHYRMKFDGCDQTYCISQLCRNRITAVCNFLNYLRYIQRGLVKSSAHEMYWEIARLRKEIALARLGLTSNQ